MLKALLRCLRILELTAEKLTGRSARLMELTPRISSTLPRRNTRTVF